MRRISHFTYQKYDYRLRLDDHAHCPAEFKLKPSPLGQGSYYGLQFPLTCDGVVVGTEAPEID